MRDSERPYKSIEDRRLQDVIGNTEDLLNRLDAHMEPTGDYSSIDEDWMFDAIFLMQWIRKHFETTGWRDVSGDFAKAYLAIRNKEVDVEKFLKDHVKDYHRGKD